MINIKETLTKINMDLRVSDVSDFEDNKIKHAMNTFSKMDNIIMYCTLNDNNKNFFNESYKILNYIKSIQFSGGNSNIMNRITKMSETLYKVSRRKEIPTINDNSNINELNVDYYYDKINNTKRKKHKFTIDIINEPVDLSKTLTDDYIEECKNTLKPIEKKETKEHILNKNTELKKYIDIDINYKGLIIYKGLFDFYYDYSTYEDINKIYNSLFERYNKINNKDKL